MTPQLDRLLMLVGHALANGAADGALPLPTGDGTAWTVTATMLGDRTVNVVAHADGVQLGGTSVTTDATDQALTTA